METYLEAEPVRVKNDTTVKRFGTLRISPGWAAVTVVFLSMSIAIGGGQYAFGVFVEPLETQFGWTRTQINGSLSFSAVGGLIAPFVGRLMDKHGSRPVVTISLIMMAVSFLLRPFMTELWHLYALSTLQFAGFPGGAMLPGARLVGIWFPRTRGRMMGITATGANFGGITMPTLMGLLVGVLSWEWGYVVLGFIGLSIAIAGLLVINETPIEKRSSEQSQGLANSGEKDKPDPQDIPGTTVRDAVRSRSFYALSIGMLAATFTYHAILTQIVPHLQNVGLSLNTAAIFLSLVAVFGLVGKIIFGYLTERFLSKNVLALSLVLQSLGLLVLITLADTPFLWVVLPVYGTALGGMGAVFPLLIQDSFGLKYFGTIFGLVNMATIGSSLVGPLMVGLVFDATGSYDLAFISVIGIFAVGVIALQFAEATFRMPETFEKVLPPGSDQ